MQTNAISLVVHQYSVLFKVQTIPAPCMKFCWLRNKYSLASVIKVFFFLILTQKMPKRIKYYPQMYLFLSYIYKYLVINTVDLWF